MSFNMSLCIIDYCYIGTLRKQTVVKPSKMFIYPYNLTGKIAYRNIFNFRFHQCLIFQQFYCSISFLLTPAPFTLSKIR